MWFGYVWITLLQGQSQPQLRFYLCGKMKSPTKHGGSCADSSSAGSSQAESNYADSSSFLASETVVFLAVAAQDANSPDT